MKKNRLSKLVAMAFVIIISSLFCMCNAVADSEFNIPDPENNFYVNDFANLFNASQKSEMLDRAVELAENADGIQVAVTTVTSLNGTSINDYATSMYNKYGIGRNDRGLLILLAITERQIWVEVGYGLEDVYTARKTGEFIDKYAIDFLKNNKFAEGLVSIQKAFIDDLSRRFVPKVTDEPVEVPVIPTQRAIIEDNSTVVENNNEYVESAKVFSSKDYLIVFLCVFFASFVSALFIFYKHNRTKKQELSNQYDELERKYDDAINQNAALEKENSELKKRVTSLNTLTNDKEKTIAYLRRKVKQLEDYISRAKKIHPNLEEEIEASIQREIDEKNKQSAENYDKEYYDLTALEPSLDETLRKRAKQAISAYTNLPADVQKYITTEISNIYNLLERCNELNDLDQAKKFNLKLKEMCDGVSHGTEESLDKYTALQQKISSSSSSVLRHIDVDAMAALLKLINEGKAERKVRLEAERKAEMERQEEQRRRDEEERRRRDEERRHREEERRRRDEEDRRRRDSFSSSSSGSSTYHSGFGGHSGGSGAGRSF